MKSLATWIALLTMSACSTKPDDCARFWDKASPSMAKASGGQPMSPSVKNQFMKQCREAGKMQKDPAFKCVLDATGDEAVAACMSKAFGTYEVKSKELEAKLHLAKIGKSAKLYYTTVGNYPIGKAGPLPAEQCCKGTDGKCAAVPDAQWEASEVWKQLEFSTEIPARFQYSYESVDGKSATATAVADFDCDGTPVVYKLQLSVDTSGKPSVEVVEPAANAD